MHMAMAMTMPMAMAMAMHMAMPYGYGYGYLWQFTGAPSQLSPIAHTDSKNKSHPGSDFFFRDSRFLKECFRRSLHNHTVNPN